MKKTDTYQIEEEARAMGLADASLKAGEKQKAKRKKEKPESEKVLWSLVDKVQKFSRKAAKFKSKRTQSEKRLGKAVRANPALDSGDPVQTMSRISVTVFAYIGAYAFDFILLGTLSGYWISLMGGGWLMVWAGKIILPFAVLFTEIGVATNLVEATTDGRRLAVYGWRFVATAFVVFVAGYTANMIMVSEGFDSLSELALGDFGFMLFMVILATMPHLLLLFSGTAGSEGKALLFLYWKRFRTHWNDRKYQKYADKTRVAFGIFTREHTDHYMYFSCAPLDFKEIFSIEAREIINEIMGGEVISTRFESSPATNGAIPPTETENQREES